MAYDSGRIQNPAGDGTWTMAQLLAMPQSSQASLPSGIQAFTLDQGLQVWNGVTQTWSSVNPPSARQSNFGFTGLYPPVAANPATFSTSGPGGSSPIATPTTYNFPSASTPISAIPVSLLGMVPVAETNLGTNYYFNNADGSGSGSGQLPFAIEFGHDGTSLDIIFRNNTANQSRFWVWASDSNSGRLTPQTAAPVLSSAASSNSRFYYQITFPSFGQRIVRVYMENADFGGIDIEVTGTIFPSQPYQRSLCVIGDSYVQGTGTGTPPVQTCGFASSLGRLLNVPTYLNGVGGTGFLAVNNSVGGNNNFLAAPRQAAAIATNATDFLIAGSVNDSTNTPAAVGIACKSLVQSIRAALPSARIWASLVQGCPPVSAGNNVAINATLGATYAALGVPYIDEYNEIWYSGTGYAGNLQNNGNRDLLTFTDAVHPTQAGHDNRAQRFYTRLMQLGWGGL